MAKPVVSCAPDVLDKVRDAIARSGKDIDIEENETFERGELLMSYRGDSVLDTGYIYAPYIPLQVTPTVLPEEKPKKTPLQELAEEIFKEEIEAGEIKPIWDNEPKPESAPDPEHLQTGVLNRRWKVYKDPRIPKIRPEFFKKVTITNL